MSACSADSCSWLALPALTSFSSRKAARLCKSSLMRFLHLTDLSLVLGNSTLLLFFRFMQSGFQFIKLPLTLRRSGSTCRVIFGRKLCERGLMSLTSFFTCYLVIIPKRLQLRLQLSNFRLMLFQCLRQTLFALTSSTIQSNLMLASEILISLLKSFLVLAEHALRFSGVVFFQLDQSIICILLGRNHRIVVAQLQLVECATMALCYLRSSRFGIAS
ncbi:hypothetical protein KC316_g45 [Hortaea werneckii]|nr:hypothetical protein KC316_g45 [Hortaea werneckii]